MAAIFMQQIKDNLLAPRLMGNFTGLNPIWIFIALLMGAQIAGFLGDCRCPDCWNHQRHH